jgi:hypothetical protein
MKNLFLNSFFARKSLGRASGVANNREVLIAKDPVDVRQTSCSIHFELPLNLPNPCFRCCQSRSSTSLHFIQTSTKRSMYKGIVKRQVSDGPRLKTGRFCLMGRQSRSIGREWDRNRMSMGRQCGAKMLREH